MYKVLYEPLILKTLCLFACTENKSSITIIKFSLHFAYIGNFSAPETFHGSLRFRVLASFRLISPTVRHENLRTGKLIVSQLAKIFSASYGSRFSQCLLLNPAADYVQILFALQGEVLRWTAYCYLLGWNRDPASMAHGRDAELYLHCRRTCWSPLPVSDNGHRHIQVRSFCL